MSEKKRMKKKIWIPLLSALVLLLSLCWAMTVRIYSKNFDRRFESYVPLMLSVDDFDGLQRTRYEFPSGSGQKLIGYLYSTDAEPKGIVIMAHGFGSGGHNSYMGIANYFARHGYAVFAYDATGNDESPGAGAGGLPQGVIDLEHAISFVEDSGLFPALPIGLFGHSWGGYCVCSVLSYRPEVAAVIACSGFNASSDLVKFEGARRIGGGIELMLPFARLHEYIKFGDYSTNTAMDGFSKSDAAVMIVHSMDDGQVPARFGYALYHERYADDPRFRFLPFEDRGHSCFRDTAYIDAFNEEFDRWLLTLGYNCEAAQNAERFAEDKARYIRNHLDRARWRDSLDFELLQEFVAFYDECMG